MENLRAGSKGEDAGTGGGGGTDAFRAYLRGARAHLLLPVEHGQPGAAGPRLGESRFHAKKAVSRVFFLQNAVYS